MDLQECELRSTMTKRAEMDEGLNREVEARGLRLGAELGLEVVSREICSRREGGDRGT